MIYLIDARAVLHPASPDDEDEDVDWSCFGLFDDKPTSTMSRLAKTGGARAEPGLEIAEIAVVSPTSVIYGASV